MVPRVFQLGSGLAALVLLLAVSVSSQSESIEGRYLLRVNIVDQPDSPIRLVFESVKSNECEIIPVTDQHYYSKPPDNVMLRLENATEYRIIAFAIESKGKGFHNVQVNALTKPFWPGRYVFRGFGTAGREEVEYSLDYVLFANGRSWGADAFHRSRQIALYFEGRYEALERLRILSADYSVPQDFLDTASNFGGYTSHDPAGEPNPHTLEKQYRNGWLHIIQMLRNSPNRRKESAELADRLEAEIPQR